MNDNGFRDIMIQKTNDELLDIITNKRFDYQNKAILDIENILIERGVELPVYKDILNADKKTSNKKKNHVILWPLIIGLLLVLIMPGFNNTIISNRSTEINIVINAILRIIVLLGIWVLKGRYYVSMVWYFLGLVFGGWALILINIAIWFQFVKSINNED